MFIKKNYHSLAVSRVSKKYKNGKVTLLAVFRTKVPVDHIFIMLGINDLQMKYDKSSADIVNDLLWYEEVIL